MTNVLDPVLVVGAGPVGLVTALRLVRAGIPVVVIERAASLPTDLRASTFHPPTLEMLANLALADALLAAGLRAPTWQIRLHETHEKAEFDLAHLAGETDFPFRLQVEQHVLCSAAAAALSAEAGAELRLNTELLDVAQTSDGVIVRLGAEGNEEQFAASFLIAADGSKSTVREQLGLEFDGMTYPETTILATTDFPFERHLPGLSNVNYVWFAGGTFSLLRLPHTWRVSLYADPDQSIDDAVQPAQIEAKLQRIVPQDGAYTVGQVRPYRIHQRIVTDYRVGRVLLAGDAAHVNSPSGGMGMNGGIHDAFALTDALVPVWRGERPLDDLDRYTLQRRPVAAQEILRRAHANRTRMQQRDPAYRAQELARLQGIASDPVKAKEYLLETSMISGLRASQSAKPE